MLVAFVLVFDYGMGFVWDRVWFRLLMFGGYEYWIDVILVLIVLMTLVYV